MGILGLYSALETMVYELYIRKIKERPITIAGKVITRIEFTNMGFEKKISTAAAQLSGKANIYGTELFKQGKEIKKLRSVIQHWDIEWHEQYFVDLPKDHPLRMYIDIEPSVVSTYAREILDHYSLKDATNSIIAS